MTFEVTMFPFEVVVAGTPTSSQTKNPRHRRAWVERVKHAALTRRQEVYELGFIDDRPLAATIYYFAPERLIGDVDNLVKPILDALTYVVFPDDNFIERVTIQKFEVDVDREFAAPSAILAAALEAEPPLVYIQISDDLKWRYIP